MENVNIGDFIGTFFVIIMFLAGIITSVGGAVAIIKKWLHGSKLSKHETTLKTHTEKINGLENRVEKLENKTIEQDRFISVMCNSMLALLDYNINGATTDKLKNARDELEEYLINKK